MCSNYALSEAVEEVRACSCIQSLLPTAVFSVNAGRAPILRGSLLVCQCAASAVAHFDQTCALRPQGAASQCKDDAGVLRSYAQNSRNTVAT